MSIFSSPSMVSEGLVLCLDAANRDSYPGTGTVWTDLSGNGNDGTLTNGPTFNSANGGGIVFDGTDDYITVTENYGMKPSVLTAEIIFKISSNTNTGYGGAPNSIQYLMFRQNSRTVTFEGYAIIYDEVSSSMYIYSASSSGPQYGISTPVNSLTLGTIYSITSIWRFNTQEIYINGKFINSGIKAAGINYNNTHTLKIGRSVPVGTTFDAAFNGTVYLAKVYNRDLTAKEVLQNYNATRARYGL